MSGDTQSALSCAEIRRLDQKIDASKELARADNALVSREVQHVQELLAQAQQSAKEAVGKAEAATAIHFASVNEFNTRMKDVTAEQASKEWATAFEKSVDGRLKSLEMRNTEVSGAAEGVKLTTGFIVGALGIVAAVLSIIGAAIVISGKIGN